MTYAENGKGRPAGSKSGLVITDVVPNNVRAHGTAVPTLTEAELIELGDLRRRTFRDNSRRTWLDLQVGDRFDYFGEPLGVLWLGPIELYEGFYLRQVAVMPVAGGPYRFEWAVEGKPLLGGVQVATPGEAECAREAWAVMHGDLRTELLRLRTEVAA